MAIITINGNDYFSYSSVADADVYLTAWYNTEAWFALDDETKGKHLVTATNWLDSLNWKEECSPQSVRETKPGVVAATQLLANSIANGETDWIGGTVQEPGTKRLKAGSAEIEFYASINTFSTPNLNPVSRLPLFIRNLIIGCIDGSSGANGFGGAISFGTCYPSTAKEPWGFYRD